MDCCIDKELESKLQIKLKANGIHSNVQRYHYEQPQWPSKNLIVAIVEDLTKNGCLKVNVVNRTIPITSVTTATTTITITYYYYYTSTATCLLLSKTLLTHLPLLNVINSHTTNHSVGDSILCAPIYFECAATIIIMFLPLHQQIHCQIKKRTDVTIEMNMCRFIVNGIVSIAQSMCTDQTKQTITTIKLVDANAMCATNEIVSQTHDKCKAIKLMRKNLQRCEYTEYTERPNNMNATKSNGHRRSGNYVDDDDNVDDQNGESFANNAFTSVREINEMAKRRQNQTERRQHYSKLPNDFTIVNTIYIEYRKMFCTFLLPILLLLCNLIPLIHAGE